MKNILNAIVRAVRGFRRPSKAANTRLLRERGEPLQSFEIRDATTGDIPALAELHVKTWTDTYWPVANPPTYAIRLRQWREQFAQSDGTWFCLVVENRAGGVGYTLTKPSTKNQPISATGRAYWFERGRELMVIWRKNRHRRSLGPHCVRQLHPVNRQRQRRHGDEDVLARYQNRL
jgi:hypothetical protein